MKLSEWRASLRRGDRVLARLPRTKHRYYGRVVKAQPRGRFRIAWDDGDADAVVQDVYPPSEDDEGVESDDDSGATDSEWSVADDEEEKVTGPSEDEVGSESSDEDAAKDADKASDEEEVNDAGSRPSAQSAAAEDATTRWRIETLKGMRVDFGYDRVHRRLYKEHPRKIEDVYRENGDFVVYARKQRNDAAKRYVKYHEMMDALLGIA